MIEIILGFVFGAMVIHGIALAYAIIADERDLS